MEYEYVVRFRFGDWRFGARTSMQYVTRPHWYIGMPGMHNIGLGTYMVVDTHGYRMDVVEACSRAVVYATSKKHTTTCVQLDIVSAIKRTAGTIANMNHYRTLQDGEQLQPTPIGIMQVYTAARQ